jgi:hypothetical protein
MVINERQPAEAGRTVSPSAARWRVSLCTAKCRRIALIAPAGEYRWTFNKARQEQSKAASSAGCTAPTDVHHGAGKEWTTGRRPSHRRSARVAPIGCRSGAVLQDAARTTWAYTSAAPRVCSPTEAGGVGVGRSPCFERAAIGTTARASMIYRIRRPYSRCERDAFVDKLGTGRIHDRPRGKAEPPQAECVVT